MIAEATAGRGDEAFDYYKRINASAREEKERSTAASLTSTLR